MNTLELEIKKVEDKPLAFDDLEHFMRGKVNVVDYGNLSKINDIRKIFNDKYDNNVILFFEVGSRNSGHYVAMWFLPEENVIQYYDPYGFTPMDDLQHSDYLMHQSDKLKYSLPLLLRKFVVENSGKVMINAFRNQQLKPSINTCGLHSVVRLKQKQMSHWEYHKWLKMKGLTGDEIVSMLTFYL